MTYLLSAKTSLMLVKSISSRGLESPHSPYLTLSNTKTAYTLK